MENAPIKTHDQRLPSGAVVVLRAWNADDINWIASLKADAAQGADESLSLYASIVDRLLVDWRDFGPYRPDDSGRLSLIDVLEEDSVVAMAATWVARHGRRPFQWEVNCPHCRAKNTPAVSIATMLGEGTEDDAELEADIEYLDDDVVAAVADASARGDVLANRIPGSWNGTPFEFRLLTARAMLESDKWVAEDQRHAITRRMAYVLMSWDGVTDRDKIEVALRRREDLFDDPEYGSLSEYIQSFRGGIDSTAEIICAGCEEVFLSTIPFGGPEWWGFGDARSARQRRRDRIRKKRQRKESLPKATIHRG